MCLFVINACFELFVCHTFMFVCVLVFVCLVICFVCLFDLFVCCLLFDYFLFDNICRYTVSEAV